MFSNPLKIGAHIIAVRDGMNDPEFSNPLKIGAHIIVKAGGGVFRRFSNPLKIGAHIMGIPISRMTFGV